MLNQVVLVGRLVKEPETRETESGAKVSEVTLAVPRSYKNADGVYDTDFVDCTAFDVVAENTSEYCRKGDIVGVKGRIQTREEEVDGNKQYTKQIVAEKVTFLSSKKEKEDENETSKDNDDEMEM